MNISNLNNLNPDVWGPNAWFFIDSVLLAYPNEPSYNDKVNYKNFLLNLKDILPCNKCRNHYKDHITNNPLTDEILSDKRKLLEWMLNIHNIIRKYQEKSPFTIEELLFYYKQNKLLISDRDIDYNNKLLLTMISIICIILLHIIFTRSNK